MKIVATKTSESRSIKELTLSIQEVKYFQNLKRFREADEEGEGEE